MRKTGQLRLVRIKTGARKFSAPPMLNRSKVDMTACSGSWRSAGTSLSGLRADRDICLLNGELGGRFARVLRGIDRTATVLRRYDMMVVVNCGLATTVIGYIMADGQEWVVT